MLLRCRLGLGRANQKEQAWDKRCQASRRTRALRCTGRGTGDGGTSATCPVGLVTPEIPSGAGSLCATVAAELGKHAVRVVAFMWLKTYLKNVDLRGAEELEAAPELQRRPPSLPRPLVRAHPNSILVPIHPEFWQGKGHRFFGFNGNASWESSAHPCGRGLHVCQRELCVCTTFR